MTIDHGNPMIPTTNPPHDPPRHSRAGYVLTAAAYLAGAAAVLIADAPLLPSLLVGVAVGLASAGGREHRRTLERDVVDLGASRDAWRTTALAAAQRGMQAAAERDLLAAVLSGAHRPDAAHAERTAENWVTERRSGSHRARRQG